MWVGSLKVLLKRKVRINVLLVLKRQVEVESILARMGLSTRELCGGEVGETVV